MAKAIIDEQNLTDIADAIRAKNGSVDTYTPSEMATAIGDLPTPTPVTKGLVFSDYDADGYPTKAEFVGFTAIPEFYCTRLQYDTRNIFKNITEITIPNGVTTIGRNAFEYCFLLTTINMPNNDLTINGFAFNACQNVTALHFYGNVVLNGTNNFDSCIKIQSVIFEKDINTISNNAFKNSTQCMLYDFSNATSVPPLYSTASLGHASGCVIKVPSALLSTWQATAVWSDLTGVVWQGV